MIKVEIKVEKDIDYLGDPGGPKADLYAPAKAPGGPMPAVVIIHGGGWVGGDKADKREVNIATTLARHGYLALSINYVLYTKASGRPTWPTNLHQCKTAVRWLRANAAKLNLDPERIGAIGGSAGGHLASLVGLTGPADGLDPQGPHGTHSCRVQAVVDLYGPADLLTHEDLAMLGKKRAEDPDLYRAASLAPYAGKDDPPVLIIHGDADRLVKVKQSQDFAAALARAGVPHELIIIPGAPHTFDLQPKQRDLRGVVVGFFDRWLRGAPDRASR